MAETQPPIIDLTQEDELLQILPRPALRSSANLGWDGISVQQHWQPAWEVPENYGIKHMLVMHNHTTPVESERWFDGRRQQEQGVGGRNNIVLIPAMISHQVTWTQECSFSLLFLDPNRLTQVAYESITADRVQLIPHSATHDPLINQIGQSLTAELENNQLHSRLFVDALMIALSIHLLRHYSDWQQSLREGLNGLPQRKLRQAIEYINEHLREDLTIGAIANELEMSQYYFSRLFKQSIGVSPYQYVMQQRIEQAKHLLRTTSLSVAAIAMQTGFSNQNQLTIQFRKFTGTTPSGYRKNL
ncbi:MAG: AraC family transcriptional regulator [Stenomitos rutilans HA7619-LM2]|jgi:AraC family transcriptional regulator|nr:AraC family transcriptional regulator [Stenomitos rutilans HA7619-LM2]